ncbi:MAG TPA: DUF1844 domain-containing protein [Chthoniobacterales bacterium]|jgi:uncharacterized protein DUF1844|nr:DUF1844 domain-containing protein [Chthoniobacterales bacterium]
MAEVQTSTQSGELSQRFIEFVMMHAQNAALFLGQIPNPKTGEGEVNLELAKMFIDQLSMIQEKTRGNLTTDEMTVLKNTLSNLQMIYVEVSQHVQKGGATQPKEPAPEPETESSTSSAPEQPPVTPEAPPAEGESKKKFTKSYGS